MDDINHGLSELPRSLATMRFNTFMSQIKKLVQELAAGGSDTKVGSKLSFPHPPVSHLLCGG